MNDDSVKKPARKSRRGKVTRDRIIEVAENLIALHGPDGFQLQNVTEILGITPPAIYNHFKDREDLVAQIAEKGGRILSGKIEWTAGEAILDSLRLNARRYVDFLIENPAQARIILWNLARRGTTGWRGLANSNIEMRDRMRDAFEAATQDGRLRPFRVEAYLQFLYIGAAAAVVWTDYDHPDQGDGIGDQDGEEFRLAPISPEKAEQMRDQAEDLVVRLLAPTLGEIDD